MCLSERSAMSHLSTEKEMLSSQAPFLIERLRDLTGLILIRAHARSSSSLFSVVLWCCHQVAPQGPGVARLIGNLLLAPSAEKTMEEMKQPIAIPFSS